MRSRLHCFVEPLRYFGGFWPLRQRCELAADLLPLLRVALGDRYCIPLLLW